MDNFVIRKKKRPLDDTTVGVDTADDTEDENVEEKNGNSDLILQI